MSYGKRTRFRVAKRRHRGAPTSGSGAHHQNTTVAHFGAYAPYRCPGRTMRGRDIEYTAGATMRGRLRRATDDLHAAMHKDAVLVPLVSPDITEAQYRCALWVFARFFEGVESARRCRGDWAAFSLARECTALKHDLGTDQLHPYPMDFDTADALLGGLYVAHGSTIGRRSFAKTVQARLPGSPDDYLRLAFNAQLWHELLTTLEQQNLTAGGGDKVVKGAQLAFRSVSRLTRIAAAEDCAFPHRSEKDLPKKF